MKEDLPNELFTSYIKLDKAEAIAWVVDTKAISPFTRNFIEWLYDKKQGAIIRTILEANEIKKTLMESPSK